MQEGEAPNRRLTVTWYKLSRYDNVDLITPGTTAFQATLHEGVNDKVFRYQDMDFGVTAYTFGASATVGVEYLDGFFGTQYSLNEPVIRDGMALRVYAKPTLSSVIVSPSDPDGFQVSGVNILCVEPRNTPTVINAVHIYRQFGNPLSFARRIHLTGANVDKIEPPADPQSRHLVTDAL